MGYPISPRTDPKGYFSVAFYGGCVAAVVMSALLGLARLAGLTRLDLAFEMGSLINPQSLPGVWCLGFILHVLFGGAFGLVYAGILDAWFRPSAAAGAALGVAHAIVIGLVFAFLLPEIHNPVDGRPLAAHPGFLAINFGVATAAVLIVAYIVYGAIIGAALAAAERGAFNFRPPPPVDLGGGVPV